jgi:hypothetical protein
MNKRIKELALQAGGSHYPTVGGKDIKAVFNGESTTLLDHLPLVTNLSASDIDDLAPSELAIIWESVQEVNASFLALMEKSGLMKSIEATAMQLLTQPSVASSNPDTSQSGNTDTLFS